MIVSFAIRCEAIIDCRELEDGSEESLIDFIDKSDLTVDSFDVDVKEYYIEEAYEC